VQIEASLDETNHIGEFYGLLRAKLKFPNLTSLLHMLLRAAKGFGVLPTRPSSYSLFANQLATHAIPTSWLDSNLLNLETRQPTTSAHASTNHYTTTFFFMRFHSIVIAYEVIHDIIMLR